ncbi:MAG: DUF1425 domain-containing protein [Victivallales bacterium]|nr:DUF1425 domain-containing protein [Victivallales bacterium]
MKRLWVLLVLVVLVTGCASVSTGGFEVSLSENDGGAFKVRFDDKQLSRELTVEKAITHRGTSDFLSIQVVIRNASTGDYPMQYKFMFFDTYGLEVRSGDRGWEQKVLHGGEAVTLAAVAPDKAVSSVIVRVRRVN